MLGAKPTHLPSLSGEIAGPAVPLPKLLGFGGNCRRGNIVLLNEDAEIAALRTGFTMKS